MPISFAGLIAAHGAPAVFFLLLFGVVPSEVVLPMAGAAARPNVASLALVAIAGSPPIRRARCSGTGWGDGSGIGGAAAGWSDAGGGSA